MRASRLALLLLLAGGTVRAEERLTCGTVDTLEFTSLTRTKATAFLRVVLPAAPAGSKSLFEGKIEVANTRIPVGQPVAVALQHREAGHEAVFLVDLELAKIPEALLGNLHAAALDITLEGNLRSSPPSSSPSSSSSSNSAQMPVCAAGVLKVGTSEIRASGALGQDFARFGGARFREMTLAETQGEATVVVYNPLSFPLDVKDLVYELRVGGRTIATGERHGVRFHAGRETSVDLPVAAGNADLVAVLAGALSSGGRVDGRLVGRISVKVGKDQVMTVPLDLPGTIQVTR